jgi:hypothetical protein
MNRNKFSLAVPFPVIFSLITALVGALIYATVLIIEEEQHDFEAVILAQVQPLLVNGR